MHVGGAEAPLEAGRARLLPPPPRAQVLAGLCPVQANYRRTTSLCTEKLLFSTTNIDGRMCVCTCVCASGQLKKSPPPLAQVLAGLCLHSHYMALIFSCTGISVHSHYMAILFSYTGISLHSHYMALIFSFSLCGLYILRHFHVMVLIFSVCGPDHLSAWHSSCASSSSSTARSVLSPVKMSAHNNSLYRAIVNYYHRHRWTDVFVRLCVCAWAAQGASASSSSSTGRSMLTFSLHGPCIFIYGHLSTFSLYSLYILGLHSHYMASIFSDSFTISSSYSQRVALIISVNNILPPPP